MSQEAGRAAAHDRSDFCKTGRSGVPDARAKLRLSLPAQRKSQSAGEQLSAWLMATWLNGLTIDETRSPKCCCHARLRRKIRSLRDWQKQAVDKHSTGGVGDKTSFLAAPLPRQPAGRCGADDQRAGAIDIPVSTLDKLDSIPGFSVSTHTTGI